MNPHYFPLPLIVEDMADGSAYQFRTTSPFVFSWCGTDKQPPRDIVVPKGFATDFASIPRPLQGFLDAVNDVAPAAVIHDFLYTSQMFESRAMADRIFFDALRANGVSWMRARTLWAGVRLGGWIKWGKDPVEASNWFILGAEAADAWERSK